MGSPRPSMSSDCSLPVLRLGISLRFLFLRLPARVPGFSFRQHNASATFRPALSSFPIVAHRAALYCPSGPLQHTNITHSSAQRHRSQDSESHWRLQRALRPRTRNHLPGSARIYPHIASSSYSHPFVIPPFSFRPTIHISNTSVAETHVSKQLYLASYTLLGLLASQEYVYKWTQRREKDLGT